MLLVVVGRIGVVGRPACSPTQSVTTVMAARFFSAFFFPETSDPHMGVVSLGESRSPSVGGVLFEEDAALEESVVADAALKEVANPFFGF